MDSSFVRFITDITEIVVAIVGRNWEASVHPFIVIGEVVALQASKLLEAVMRHHP